MEPQTEIKTVLGEIKSSVETYGSRIESMQRQLDAQDVRFADKVGYESTPSAFIEHLKSHEGVQRLLRDRRGSAILTLSGKDAEAMLSHKTTLTATGQGFTQSGVLPIERIPGITPEARQVLTVRDALTARPTSMPVVDFVMVTTPNAIASPVAEASVKQENTVVLASSSEKIRTIATWQPASRQILDDLTELASFLENWLTYYVNLAEEIQFLSGDNTGENIHGLIPQASVFNTGLLSATEG
jgi:HK97 family phage major capsid protein